MRRFFAAISIASLLTGSTPVIAETLNLYAVSVVYASNQTYRPERALGAPDGLNADFFTENANIDLDFGRPINSGLTLTYYLYQFGAQFRVDFEDADGNVIVSRGDSLPLGTVLVVSYTGAVPYQRVRVTDIGTKPWSLDALRAETLSMDSPVVVPEPVPSTPPARGALVKLPSDDNVTTTFDAAVYEIDGDGKRHAFPTESVFFSWYLDFASVQVLSAEKLASYPLGKNVTMRPGTKLLKLTNDPRVYAVYPNATLRWVPTESAAVSLFGTDWNKKIVDMADVFFTNYQMGTTLASTDAPPILDTANPYPY